MDIGVIKKKKKLFFRKNVSVPNCVYRGHGYRLVLSCRVVVTVATITSGDKPR